MDGKRGSGLIEEPEDFEDAFREHFAPVYRFIARRVGSALAEDLAAEAFATAYRRRAAYQPDRGSLRSWLYGIATNMVREHWRDEQQLLELDARVAPAGCLRSFADAADERVVAATLAPRIAGALAALSREQRDVLLLHAWADLSHEEIAAALGIATGRPGRGCRGPARRCAPSLASSTSTVDIQGGRPCLTRSTCCARSGRTPRAGRRRLGPRPDGAWRCADEARRRRYAGYGGGHRGSAGGRAGRRGTLATAVAIVVAVAAALIATSCRGRRRCTRR